MYMSVIDDCRPLLQLYCYN